MDNFGCAVNRDHAISGDIVIVKLLKETVDMPEITFGKSLTSVTKPPVRLDDGTFVGEIRMFASDLPLGTFRTAASGSLGPSSTAS